MSFKEALKKIPILYPLARSLKAGVKDISAIPGFLAERKLRRDDSPIRVGFLCQYIPIWHKLQPVYESMTRDPRFAPFLICVPSDVSGGKRAGNSQGNDTLDYFRDQGYTEAIDACLPKGDWLSLEQLGLEYVFYPRPYDDFMPDPYKSHNVYRFCKICMVLYGMNTTREITKTTINRDFFRYVHCYFAELPYSMETNKNNGWLLHTLGLQKTVYYGMPGIESIREAQEDPRPAWNFSNNDFRVLWCPRWTTDPTMGGSNFFTFYNFLLDYAAEHVDSDFLFRPHPLALSHFQQTGEMSAEDVRHFVSRCEALPNVSLDKEKEYAATFWGTSVMISDISGMIPEYFVTGQPLIYCAANMHLTPEYTTSRILECSYIVYTPEELSQCLNDLKNGIDPLKEKRLQLVRELYSEPLSHPAKKIVAHLANRQ